MIRDTRQQRILNINLTTGESHTEILSQDDLLKHLGGRGIAAKLLYERLEKGADPLGPENPLIFSAGSLSGTSAPSTGRASITCKSPATQRYLKVNVGGHVGPELRYAGWDYLVISGASPQPCYLWISDGKVEILDAIPEGYPGRDKVLALLQAHIRGLCNLQSGEGLWHQLLDRNDSYLETSASAIYVYSLAKAINEGWIDMLAYGSQTILGWHGVTTRVNELGEIEGTCVGTGMGFDPAFYYYRPVNKAAGHGYGPLIYAGAEVYRLLKSHHVKMNDSALLFYKEKVETDAAIFYIEENGVRDHH